MRTTDTNKRIIPVREEFDLVELKLQEAVDEIEQKIMGITGEDSADTPPDINLVTTSSQIIKITGEVDNSTEPDINLATTSSQIIKITGEVDNSTEPDINLATTKIHVDTSLAVASSIVHGLSAFNSDVPANLGLSGYSGFSLSPARSDHQHKFPTLAEINAMSGTHSASGFSGFGEVSTLGSGWSGSLFTASRSNHIHQMPTATDVGAISTSALSNSTPNALTATGNSGTSTNVSRSDHAHPKPSYTATDVGAISTSALSNSTPNALTATGNSGTSTNVSRSDHAHPLPTLTALGASAAGTYDYSISDLSLANVFDNIAVTNGLVTSIATRALTPNDISAAPKAGDISQAFSAKNLTTERVIVDIGTAGGMKGTGVSAVFGFGTSGSVAAVFCDAGLYIKTYSNGAYAPLICTAITCSSIYCTGHIGYGTAAPNSDRRLKTDIKDSDLGLDFILSLSPKTFHWISEKKDNPINVRPIHGFIAQDIIEMGEKQGRDLGFSHYFEEQDVYGLNYNEFIAPLVAAFQEEHKSRISSEELLLSKIEALTARITELESRL